MKKTSTLFSSQIMVLVLCLSSFTANSQDAISKKEARKESNNVENQTDYKNLGLSLERKKFIVEMENQLHPGQNNIILNPMLNFIMVDSSKCVLQSDSENLLVTLKKYVSKVEGTTDRWKLSKNDKSSSYYVQYIMVTDNGRYHVFMTINSDRTASGNISSSNTNYSFYGKLVML